MQSGHSFPEGTYVNHGDILCDRINEISQGEWLDSTRSTYYAMGPMLPKGFRFANPIEKLTNEVIHTARVDSTHQYIDQDVLGGFDPSRVPPRIASKLMSSRGAIHREITDLLQAKPNEPPAMVEVYLLDSRFNGVPRVHSTLVIKRKGGRFIQRTFMRTGGHRTAANHRVRVAPHRSSVSRQTHMSHCLASAMGDSRD